MARQGVGYPTLEGVMVADPETMTPVARDGKTMGEVILRGNTVMKGYLKNPVATRAAFRGGWFHSGAENISSLEVEEVLYRRPAVMEAAVVARPDEKWGEVPFAFVTLKPGAPAVTAADVTQWCRDNLARYKVPKHVVYGPLPTTSTGKIQKYVLREQAGAG